MPSIPSPIAMTPSSGASKSDFYDALQVLQAKEDINPKAELEDLQGLEEAGMACLGGRFRIDGRDGRYAAKQGQKGGSRQGVGCLTTHFCGLKSTTVTSSLPR